MSLEEIALVLLHKYRLSEETCIWELSMNIEKDMKMLDAEIDHFKKLIKEAEY